MDDMVLGTRISPDMIHVENIESKNGDFVATFQILAFQKQMRMILLPAMSNIVRRLVIECGADGVDPAIRAIRMDMEDVEREIREEASWYNGIDWLERRANGERERRSRATKEDDESSLSSKSSGSHTTSPVLSTTTLGTTPSPPASVDEHHPKKDADLAAARSGRPVPVVIPISPVLESPVLLHPIPYIPVTVSQMPHYSQEAFRLVRYNQIHFWSFG